ncbi:aspartate dehydrogenase [Rhodobacteraceae bacterium CCMM004]|nr:aspartate dehydrogenase [Rhodobacteraceae bacterium CCMM004]
MAVRRRAADDRLLGGGRAIPARPDPRRPGSVAGDRHLGGDHRAGLAALRRTVQIGPGRPPYGDDAGPLCDHRGHVLGAEPGVHGPRRAVAPGRLHRDDHDRQRLLHHHPQPEDRGRRPQGRAHPGPEIRQDRQAALDPQQLPDPARHLPDAVEPLSAGVCHGPRVDHRGAGVPDGSDDPPLLQLDARAKGAAELDLGGDGRDLSRHRLAVDGEHGRHLGGKRGAGADPGRGAVRVGRGLCRRLRHGAGPLLDVPRARAGVGPDDVAAQGRRAGDRGRRGAPRRPDLPPGRGQPRHAAAQRGADGPGSAGGHRALVPRGARLRRVHLGIVGYGPIGAGLAAALSADPVGRLTVLVRAGRGPATPVPTAAAAAVEVVEDAADLIAAAPDLVVECAGQGAVRDVVPALLAAGIDTVIASVGALADPATRDALRAAAEAGGGRAILPSGAIGGLDLLAALAVGGDLTVRYRGTKPPRAWAGTPAEEVCDLAALTAPATVFHGSARTAALRFPKNANVAAALALAGAGFDATEVVLIADPAAAGNRHAYEAVSPLGRFAIEIEAAPTAGNARTSQTTIYSLLAEVTRRRRPAF